MSAHHFILWQRIDPSADRLAVADEIVAIGSELGDRDLVMQGRTWRLFDLMRAGEAAAIDHEIEAYAPLAVARRHPRYLWMVHNLRAMRGLWRGAFESVETEALAALALAERVGDESARLNPSIQLFVLRREQGRLADQEPAARFAAARFPASPVPHTFLALLLADAGRLEEARQSFEHLARDDFRDLRREQRVGVLPYLADVCTALGDTVRAAALAELLLPHLDTVVPFGISAGFGVGAHYLAQLEALMGHRAAALDLAERALVRHVAMDAAPWLARTQLLLADLLMQRDGNRARARSLAKQALSAAQHLGMDGVATAARALLATPAAPHAVDRSTTSASRIGIFRREGRAWLVGDGSAEPLRLKHGKGFTYLAELLRQPGRALPANALSGTDSAEHALEAEQLAALRDEVEEAARFNDSARLERARAALQAASAVMAEQAGLGGRRRPGSTAAERARLNVTRTIAAAIRSIGAADARLGRYFESTIRTGALCSFTPDPRLPIEWDVAADPAQPARPRRRR